MSEHDTINGIICVAGVPDANGNVFTNESLVNAVKEANDSGRINKTMWMIYNNRESDIIATIDDLKVIDGAACVAGRILKTPMGETYVRIAEACKLIADDPNYCMSVPLSLIGDVKKSHNKWLSP